MCVTHTYEDIISVENLLEAWREFLCGKRSRRDVEEFGRYLTEHIFTLHRDLATKTYHHAGYTGFKINDPKPRDIHKACVRDRLLHHALYRKLYPLFDKTFIADSYSCRNAKGAHKAISRFRTFTYQVSKNHTRTAWVLKCDIRKFFASIDQRALSCIIRRYVPDKDICELIDIVIESFHIGELGKGLPLGNLTSQLFVNVYMNEFDQFVKHTLKARHYMRYADDFVFVSEDRVWLESLLPRISNFLRTQLALELHPNKVSIATIASGIDFLGWVHFPDHRVLRTSTKRRMLKGLSETEADEVVQSYLGLLSHGNTHKLQKQIKGGI